MSHNLNQLVIYTELEHDSVLNDYYTLITTKETVVAKKAYYDLVRGLLMNGKSLYEHILGLLTESFSPMLERLSHSTYEITELDYACLKNDLMILSWLFHFDAKDLLKSIDNQYRLMSYMMTMNQSNAQINDYGQFFGSIKDKPIFHEQCNEFARLIKKYGTGQYAGSYAFYLDHEEKLVPILKYKPLPWDQIYDYEVQKEKLYNNTKALVSGKPFHHALLVGASGTGKSSSVKAVAQLFKDDKLRLIQLYKGQLKSLPKLLEALIKTPFKFILFIDDLSFEVNEDEYKFLKSFIEGGIANEATNVAFYVTSNRRHLIKEIRSDREGDIHLHDFIQEMTSLSGRFALNLTFDGLTQRAYYEMVHKMVRELGIMIPKDELEVEAKRWSMRHGGMSGRIANQLVKHIQMTMA